MSVYRLGLRFDLNDEKERRAAEFLRNLDSVKYGSRNQFAIEAVCAYIDGLDSGNNGLLEQIRQVFREEFQSVPLVTASPGVPTKLELTEEQRKQNAKSVLEALEMFG